MTQGGYPGGGQQSGYGAPQGGGYNQPQGGSYGAPQGGQYGTPQGGQYGAPQGDYNQAPTYGQAGYSPSAGYGLPPSYNSGSTRSVGAVGLGLTLLGLIAVVVGMFTLDWADNGPDSKFTDIADAIDKAPDGQVLGYPTAYFGWLGWVLLVGCAIVAILANLPTPAAGALRPLGLLIGIGAGVATVFAIKLVDSQSLTDNIKNTGPGYWTVIAGFVVVGIGAAIGPKRG